MKKFDVLNLNNIISQLKTKGLTKEGKLAVIELQTLLTKEVEDIQKYRDNIQKETRPEGIEEGQENDNENPSVQKWNKEMAELFSEHLNKDIELSYDKISMDDFIILADSGDGLTLGQQSYIKPFIVK